MTTLKLMLPETHVIHVFHRNCIWTLWKREEKFCTEYHVVQMMMMIVTCLEMCWQLSLLFLFAKWVFLVGCFFFWWCLFLFSENTVSTQPRCVEQVCWGMTYSRK